MILAKRPSIWLFLWPSEDMLIKVRVTLLVFFLNLNSFRTFQVILFVFCLNLQIDQNSHKILIIPHTV